MVLLKEARIQTDAALVDQCRAGDSQAFDEIMRRYKDRVYNVVYRFLGNREDTLEVCQDAFVRAYRAIGSFKGDAKIYTWIYSIATNLARNRLRDQGRKGRGMGASLEALEEAAPGVMRQAGGGNPRSEAMSAETQALLERCLEELPEACRMTFILRTYEDMRYEEIAAAMDCPVGTVRSRLNQARRQLRERLKELGAL